MTILYDALNNLKDISLIGGTDKVLTFTTFEGDGVTPLNITGSTITWLLCEYGDYSTKVLSISGNIATAYTFTVAIPDTDTLLLSGKYIQQIQIVDYTGKTFRPGQGVVLILPAIPTS